MTTIERIEKILYDMQMGIDYKIGNELEQLVAQYGEERYEQGRQDERINDGEINKTLVGQDAQIFE